MASKTSFLLLVIVALHSTTGFGGDGGIIAKDREEYFGDDLWEVNDLEDAEWAFYQEMAGIEDSGADLRYPSTWPCNYEKFNENSKYRHPMTYPPTTCAIKRRGVTPEDISVILKTHNNFRNKVAGGDEKQGSTGPQPKATNMRELRWNEELATVAQAWADQCIWGHDNNSAICTRPYSVGQNAHIKWTFSEDANWEDAITGWYNEVVNHPKEGAANFTSAVHKGQVIGHYTQVVWAKTLEIGCGAIYKTEFKLGYDFPWTRYYFCNYGPGANVLYTPVYESSGACPNGESGNSNYPNLCK